MKMKTPIELRKLYKEETGNPFCMIEYAMDEVADDNEWNSLTVTEYINWLEEKIINIQKRKNNEKSL